MELSMDSISRQLVSERDRRIVDAITTHLGRDDWTLNDMQGRLYFSELGGRTSVMLDERLLMQFDRPIVRVETENGATYLKASQQFGGLGAVGE